MTELQFIKEIILRKYPFRILILALNELLGAVTVIVSIGAIIPLLGSLVDSNTVPSGKIGELVEFLGLSDASSMHIIGFLIATQLARLVLDATREYIAGSIGIHLNQALKEEMSSKISKSNWCEFTNIDQGKYIQCMTVESSLARGAVNDLAAVIAYGVMTAILLLSIAFFSFPTLIIVALSGVVFIILSRTLMKKSYKISRDRIEGAAALNSIVIDNKNIAKLLKAEGLEKNRYKLVKELIDQHKLTEIKQLLYAVLINNYNTVMALIIMALLSYLYLVQGLGDGSSLIFTLLLIQRTTSYFGNFQSKRRNMLQKIPSYESCIDILKNMNFNISEKNIDIVHGKKAVFDNLISFEDVKFSYINSINVLDGIDLSIPSYGTVAILGHSGSGKTTIIDIMLGLILPQKGMVKIDNVNLRKIDRESWQSMLAYVPQQAYLFKGSLRDNLTFGIDNCKDEDIWSALEETSCQDFVKRLPEGLDTQVEPGGDNFSGGERQRLSITRAILRKSRILVMDEPSSALDKSSEQKLKDTVKNLSNNMLIVIITHSIDFIEGIDNIYMIDSGKCIWHGNYSQLINSNLYKKYKE